MRLPSWLAGVFVLSAVPGLKAEAPGDEVRRDAWKVAEAIVEKIEIGEVSDNPGLAAWRREFIEAGKAPRAIDADRLVTRNPLWWVAHYEVAPGDPAVMLLHCEVLLAGGEAQRAQQLAAIYLQRPGNPNIYREGMRSVVAEGAKAQEQANAITGQGIELHDRGDFDGALAKYEEALKAWPANGWTAYERGFSTYVRALVKAGKPVPKNGTITINDKTFEQLPERREIEAAYAEARRHDPLQFNAYQGGEPMVKPLKAMVGKVMPIWEKLRANVSRQLDDEALAQLADGFHEAGLHEYALAAREVMVARRKKFAPEDHPIISEHLRALAPAAAIEHTIALLAGETRTARVFVSPEPGYEMMQADKKK